MIALTLIDDNAKNPAPWASLMEAGIKTDESRTWRVPGTYNGQPLRMPFDLLICASASSRTANAGKAVCVVEVYDCQPFTTEYERTACCESYPGFVWRTRNLRWLTKKFPVKGRMGLFTVDRPAGVIIYAPKEEQLQHAIRAIRNAYPTSSNGTN